MDLKKNLQRPALVGLQGTYSMSDLVGREIQPLSSCSDDNVFNHSANRLAEVFFAGIKPNVFSGPLNIMKLAKWTDPDCS